MSRDPFREGAPAATARRRRSIAIALMLIGFVALVFVVTMIRLSQNTRGPDAAAVGTARQ